MQDAKELLRRAGNESMEWGIRIQALNGLSKMLEVEESKYEVFLHPATTQQAATAGGAPSRDQTVSPMVQYCLSTAATMALEADAALWCCRK